MGVTTWLIKWKGLPEKEATSEECEFICRKFPEHHLEDNVNFQDMNIDMNHPNKWSKVYQRRERSLKGAINYFSQIVVFYFKSFLAK